MAARAHLDVRVAVERTVDSDWSAPLKDEQDQKIVDAILAALEEADLPYKLEIRGAAILYARTEN